MPYADVNGTRLYYELKGAGPAVVFIHGWTLDTTMWDDQYDEFAKHYTVLRYDLRGYGKSALPQKENLYAHHEDLKALLDHLEIQKAAIIGRALATLIVVGELDIPDCLEVANVLEEKIAGSEKMTLKGVGHMSNMEDPTGFNKTILSFLSRRVVNT